MAVIEEEQLVLLGHSPELSQKLERTPLIWAALFLEHYAPTIPQLWFACASLPPPY